MKKPKKLWFKTKRYGWGWVPASWEGWTVIGLFLALTTYNFFRIDSRQHSSSDTLLNFIPQTIVLVIILIAICYYTGEKPRWRWGK